MKKVIRWYAYLVWLTFIFSNTSSEISDKRLCADPDCRTILSLARTLIKYQTAEDGVLSFSINKDVRVYSKSAGLNPQLWGVEIQGQRGYANKGWLREYRILIKPSEIIYEVPTERQYRAVKNWKNNSSDTQWILNNTAYLKSRKVGELIDLAIFHEDQVEEFSENKNIFEWYNKSQLNLFDIREENEVIAEDIDTKTDCEVPEIDSLHTGAPYTISFGINGETKLSKEVYQRRVKSSGLAKQHENLPNMVCKTNFYELLQFNIFSQSPRMKLKYKNSEDFQRDILISAENSGLLSMNTPDEYRNTIDSTKRNLKLNKTRKHQSNENFLRNPLLSYQKLICLKFDKTSRSDNNADSAAGQIPVPQRPLKHTNRLKKKLFANSILPTSHLKKQQGLSKNILRILGSLLPSSDCQGKLGFTPMKTSCFNAVPGKYDNQSSLYHNPMEYIHSSICDKQNSPKRHTCNKGIASFVLLGIDHRADLIICLAFIVFSVIILTIGFYCLNQKRRDCSAFSKLNMAERNLLTSYKEIDALQRELKDTLKKLACIENNSFGTNDMVILLRKELQQNELENDQLREHVASLEKELENAAEAGLELNRIVSELLNNHHGNDSIVNSVEELQKQLNEQQKTIQDINSILADKSRENSELQILLSDLNAKYKKEFHILTDQNDYLKKENNSIRSNYCEMKNSFERDLADIKIAKNEKIERMNKELTLQSSQLHVLHTKYKSSEARVEALEETIHKINKDSNYGTHDIFNVVEIQAKYLATKMESDSLKEKLENEMEASKALKDQNKIAEEKLFVLKEEYVKSEKEKLEAVTRLDVLSNYFKEKETQLQNELSIRESKWMEEQGEAIGTVERLTFLQNEIQVLRSHNDSLRAEMEAQIAAHKIQISSLENRAHESWLAARYSDRKLEEARHEAAVLRRRITSYFGNSIENYNIPQDNQNLTVLKEVQGKKQYASSLQRQENVSPSLNEIHAAFHPSPLIRSSLFLGLPPPHMPTGDLRPPPLGRLMSPPPPLSFDIRSPFFQQRSPESNVLVDDNRQFPPKYESETDVTPPLSPRHQGHDGHNFFSSHEDIFELGNESRNQFASREGKIYHIKSPSKSTVKGIRGNCDTDSDKNSISDW